MELRIGNTEVSVVLEANDNRTEFELALSLAGKVTAMVCMTREELAALAASAQQMLSPHMPALSFRNNLLSLLTGWCRKAAAAPPPEDLQKIIDKECERAVEETIQDDEG